MGPSESAVLPLGDCQLADAFMRKTIVMLREVVDALHLHGFCFQAAAAWLLFSGALQQGSPSG